MRIANTRDLAAAFRNGPFSSIGGYPLFFLTSDGEALSHAAVRENYRAIAASTREGMHDGWCVVGHCVNWEDPELYCAHTGERIESAYAERDTDPDDGYRSTDDLDAF